MSVEDRLRYWQIRARQAERILEYEKQEQAQLLEWFTQRITRERDLSDRCEFLYGVARSLGATDADLAPPSPTKGSPIGEARRTVHVRSREAPQDGMLTSDEVAS